MTEFRLLGPVEAIHAAQGIDLGPPQRRAVLAALAVDVGRPVPVETVVERVWDEAPDGARRAVYVHLSHLRRALPEVGGRAMLLRRSGGYVLDARPDSVDAHRFAAAVSTAAALPAGDAGRAAILHRALSLWRGAPLAGLAGCWAERIRQRWAQARTDALIAWAEAELLRGRPAQVVGPLREAAGDGPVEPLAALLMRALDESGRASEALRYYATLRRQLVAELGAEPGPALRELHRAILIRNAAPPVPPPAPRPEAGGARAAGPARVPAQLPPAPHGFVGRAGDLARLDTWLAADGRAAPPIAVVTGGPGVGKTALVVTWAQARAAAFPDGQLYLDLRGFDPERPVRAEAALAVFLGDLGVPEAELPTSLEGRLARYRSRLAGRRLLVLLDNASTVDQIRPLLPGAGSCAVLITSRDSLSPLVAQYGAQRLALDALKPAAAVALLRCLLGDRADREPGAAALVAARCGHLPIALRVAAELAARRPDRSLAALAEELADERGRLDVLDTGDERTAVRSVFSWSFRHLPEPAVRLFGLLAAAGGPVDAATAAELAGIAVADARRLLHALAGEHLVHPAGERYGVAGLLRAYAAVAA